MFRIVCQCILLAALHGCAVDELLVSGESCTPASSWPAADQLFRSSPHWVGADSAFSVDLGDSRTLWLFADTFIDHSGKHSREDLQVMIRNSVAIQKGRNPETATIKFYWNGGHGLESSAFFPHPEDGWYWPGHGVRLGDRLLLFMNSMRGTDKHLGFESAGWDAYLVENPDDDIQDWKLSIAELPDSNERIQLGFAGVLLHGDHVYAYGSPDEDKRHPIHMARWPYENAYSGQLTGIEWWGGDAAGWVSGATIGSKVPLFTDAFSEATFHYDEEIGRFVATHTIGFGDADVVFRTSESITGPWSEPRTIFRPPEYGTPRVMIYAGKAHPQLAGAHLVLTYATNSFEFTEYVNDPGIYYPRFIRVNRCTLE